MTLSLKEKYWRLYQTIQQDDTDDKTTEDDKLMLLNVSLLRCGHFSCLQLNMGEKMLQLFQ